MILNEREIGEEGDEQLNPYPSHFSSGRINRDPKQEDNSEQTNESVTEIMNGHFYGRLHRWCGGEDSHGNSQRNNKKVSLTHVHTNTRAWMHRHTRRHTYRVAYMTWRWICNCSVFNPAMCLLSRRVRITVPSKHTQKHTHTHRKKSLFFFFLTLTFHLTTNYTCIPSTPTLHLHFRCLSSLQEHITHTHTASTSTNTP